jgi:hypothetical protein
VYSVGRMEEKPVVSTSDWTAAKKRGRSLVVDGTTVRLANLPSLSPHFLMDHVKRDNEEALASWCSTFYGFDVWCRQEDGTPMDVPQCIELLDRYIGFECSLRQIKPDTIRSVYLQGIAKHFDMKRPVLMSNFRTAINVGRVKSLLDGYKRA